MTSRPPPQCLSCRHWVSPLTRSDADARKREPTQTCSAYPLPGGIPETIWANREDHRQPRDGDHGVQWEPRSAGVKFPEWAMRVATRSTVDDPDEWIRLQAAAGRYLTLPEVRRGYKRDDIGRFSSGGGGFSGSPSSGPAGDGDDGPDLGEHGFGRDPNGKSYTEHDVDSSGAPRFSQAYRDRYGPVESETQLGSSSTSLVTTERGIHVADDTRGTRNREVVQELTPRQAASLSDDVYQVNSEGGTVTNRPTGVTVAASGGPARDGSYPTRVTFRNGTSVDLSADDAFEFQEALTLASGETRSAVRSRLHRYMTAIGLPVPDDAEVRRGYKRDPKGRFSSGGGGGAGGSAPAKAAPAKKAAPKKAAPAAAAAGEAGTGKVGKKMARQPKVDNPDDVAAQARAANPRYGGAYEGRVPPEVEAAGDYVGYTNNCTRVAIAYEMRRRGIDATAGAATQRGGSQAEHFRSFREDGKYPARLDRDLGRSMSAKEVAAEARSWPVGARGIVTMDGHTLNIERTSSGVRFVDAQTGSRQSPVLTPAQFASRAASRGAEIDRGMAVARVDDLDMSDYSLHYVESSALSLSDGLVVKTTYPSHPGGQRLTDEELAVAVPDDTYP